MGCCTLKLDEEKSKNPGSAQGNGFGPEFLQKLLRKCNKYVLTIAPCFLSANNSDWFELVT